MRPHRRYQSVDLHLTAHETCHQRRQIPRYVLKRPHGREPVPQTLAANLEQATRPRQIPQPVLTQIDQLDPVHQRLSRRRDKDLAAVARRHHPSRPVQCRPKIVIAA